MTLSGESALAGIMGWPVGHSKSPRLHGYWLEHYGIDGTYIPLAVRPEDFEPALRALAALGFRGVNVTLPHKEAALAACDEVDPKAQRIGAVNTIQFQQGRIVGSNSDGFGFIENLRDSAPGWQAEDGVAVVLGAGGSARAVLSALIDEGVPEIILLNRTSARAEALAEAIGGPIKTANWQERSEQLRDASLLVNTTSLGMVGQSPLDIDLAHLPGNAVVTDLVYQPLQTGLLAAAKQRGNQVVDGLGMLLHQARPGFASWFGVEPEVTEAMRSFVLDTARQG